MRFPNASQSFRDANPHLFGSGPAPKLEPNPRNAALAAPQAESRNPGRAVVRVTSIRKRLLDPDNLCEKYHLDGLRYAGLLRDDTEAEISLQTGQRKAAKGEEERTEIEIQYLAHQPK